MLGEWESQERSGREQRSHDFNFSLISQGVFFIYIKNKYIKIIFFKFSKIYF